LGLVRRGRRGVIRGGRRGAIVVVWRWRRVSLFVLGR
jgi:hypothetical protein